MARQYVTVTFTEGGGRKYTYHHDEQPLQVGQHVKVPAPRSDGWLRAEVVEVSDDAPKFATKAIMGVIEPEGDEA